MNETIKYIFLFTLSLNLIGCNGQSTSVKFNYDYQKDKAQFDTIFTKHFPNSVETIRALTIKSKSPKINKIRFFLYEFGVNIITLDSLTQMVKTKQLISYNWNDSCLFIIYPNETLDPFDDEPSDTIESNLDCLNRKLPIPNFINLKSPNSQHGISMDSTFNIYILESKAGNHSQYNMEPLKSMPKGWENGFSIGYAISRVHAVIVYWMIIW